MFVNNEFNFTKLGPLPWFQLVKYKCKCISHQILVGHASFRACKLINHKCYFEINSDIRPGKRCMVTCFLYRPFKILINGPLLYNLCDWLEPSEWFIHQAVLYIEWCGATMIIAKWLRKQSSLYVFQFQIVFLWVKKYFSTQKGSKGS